MITFQVHIFIFEQNYMKGKLIVPLIYKNIYKNGNLVKNIWFYVIERRVFFTFITITNSFNYNIDEYLLDINSLYFFTIKIIPRPVNMS